MGLQINIFQRTYQFNSLNEVMAKANEEKSGDRLAGIAAEDVKERVAAKTLLSEITLRTLREQPAISYEADEVTRVIQDDVDEGTYERIRDMTVGQLRDFLLAAEAKEIEAIRDGLTAEMIAAVTKLMGNMDLVAVSKKLVCTATCNTTIGLPGTLSSRLQPNHPTDSLEGIRASMMEGLSYGVGDAVIGLNPAGDTAEKVKQVLTLFNDFTNRFNIPTQGCVLAHITAQIKALRNHAPMDLMFQSLAGSQDGNRAFGISKALLDEGYALMQTLKSSKGDNFMYFETGQGSELSSDAHHGVDQLTLEARCYGLAKHYRPFLVNTVVGFIGPEYLYDGNQVIRAGLEDHFMGKLTGLPMGVDVCYTNHMKADQNTADILSLLLAQAGCNYYMGVPGGDDVMLMYQTNSYQDIAALREISGKRPIPEFEARLQELGILEGARLGPKAGDITVFLEDEAVRENVNLIAKTPARLSIGRSGTRYTTGTYLTLRQAHAVAQDAVWNEADETTVESLGFFKVQTMVSSKEQYIVRPDLGRIFSDETSRAILENCSNRPDVQIIAGDGLSSKAVSDNIARIYPVLIEGLADCGYSVGTPVYVKYARVGTMDRISELLQAKVTIILIGERPGLASDDSMSAYMAYEASTQKPESQRTVLANIHSTGLNPMEAGAHIVTLVQAMMEKMASGVELSIEE